MENEGVEDKPLSRWWALPALAFASGLTVLMHNFVSFARAEAVGISSAVLFGVTLPLWKRHRERWFWPSVASAIGVHALGIWLIPWPANHEFQKSDLNFVWLDFFLYFATAMAADQLTKRNKPRT